VVDLTHDGRALSPRPKVCRSSWASPLSAHAGRGLKPSRSTELRLRLSDHPRRRNAYWATPPTTDSQFCSLDRTGTYRSSAAPRTARPIAGAEGFTPPGTDVDLVASPQLMARQHRHRLVGTTFQPMRKFGVLWSLLALAKKIIPPLRAVQQEVPSLAGSAAALADAYQALQDVDPKDVQAIATAEQALGSPALRARYTDISSWATSVCGVELPQAPSGIVRLLHGPSDPRATRTRTGTWRS
jgi:hypothetical protein